MVNDTNMINVEVAFALPDDQRIIALQVPAGTTAYEAVLASGIVDLYPQIKPDQDPMGVFGKSIRDPKTEVLKEGQRVEIYRPLLIDPKQARANRAAKLKAETEQKEAEPVAAKPEAKPENDS